MFKNLLQSFSLSHLLLIFFWFVPTGNGFIFPSMSCLRETVTFTLFLIFVTLIVYLIFFWASYRFIHYLGAAFSAYILLRGVKSLIQIKLAINVFTLIFFLIVIAIASVLGYLFFKRELLFRRLLRNALLFFVPFGLITFYNLFWDIKKLSSNTFLAKKMANNQKHRIFWIIFDELDENLVFSLRPKKHSFPNLDLFRSQSLYCTRMLQPGPCTTVSLPSYLLGKKIQKVSFHGAFDFFAKSQSNQSYSLEKSTIIFDKARSYNYNSALIGWYIPYDRLFKHKVSYLSLYECPDQKSKIFPTAKQFLIHVGMFFKFNFEKLFKNVFKLDLFNEVSWFLTTDFLNLNPAYERLCSSISEVIKDKELQFVFFHLPYPHYPTIYSPEKDLIEKRKPCYYDNVYLVDKLLQHIKKCLTDSDQWDSSSILITSDHWLRTQPGFIDDYLNEESEDFFKILEKRKEPLVPFMLKLPGQKSSEKYDHKIDAVIAHDLILSLMENPSKTVEEVIQFLDKNNNS